MNLSPLFGRGVALAGTIIAADQAVKWWILEHVMMPPRVIEVTSFFNLVMTWNRGVSFGLFNTDSPYNALILSIVAGVIAVALLIWLARADRPVLAYGLGTVIGGAIGNVIDRVRFGAVADFLDFHISGYHWPAFNVADSAITIGVAVLIVDSLFGPADERQKKKGLGRETSE
ncbi:MAG TPA: signal peptidase II [Rhodospirillales bacterium]|nr:signal peptidase II [Rhodospirillales bacterium]